MTLRVRGTAIGASGRLSGRCSLTLGIRGTAIRLLGTLLRLLGAGRSLRFFSRLFLIFRGFRLYRRSLRLLGRCIFGLFYLLLGSGRILSLFCRRLCDCLLLRGFIDGFDCSLQSALSGFILLQSDSFRFGLCNLAGNFF